MAEVIVRRKLSASAQAAWEIQSDFGGVAETSAMIESCSVEGEGVGAVRTLGMPGGLSLKERLEAFDAPNLTYSYSIVGDTPLPFTDYLSTVTICPDGDDACVIEWRGRFEPKDDEAAAAKIIGGIYSGGLAALGKRLGADVSELD